MSIGDITNVTTGEVRLSFVHLFKPYAFKQGDKERYSCTILLPKSDTDTMSRINAAIEAAKQKGLSNKWNGQCPPVIPTPIHDGDGVKEDGTAYGPECRGHWVFNANSEIDYPPEVVDAQGNPIINQSEIYSGVYAYVNIEFFPYLYGTRRGIGCSLGPVMKRRDGEALAGAAPTAAQAFGAPQPAPQAYTQPVQQPAAQPVTQQPYTSPQGQTPWGPQGINPITGQPM